MIDVLIADDQELARMGHTLVVGSAPDLRVAGEAATGEEAVELTHELQPDIVLMDVRMPGAGGIVATQAIVEAHPSTRVIALTSFDLDQYAFGMLEAGASAFLLKTSSPERLLDAIRTVHRGDAVVEPRITRLLIDRALNREPRTVDLSPSELDVLSPRERDVFHAIAAGLTNTEISEQLHLTPATVKSHINRVFAKLHLRDRVQAVIFAQRLGITS